jgi:hypothetical protein
MDKDKLIEILELFLAEYTQELGRKLMVENFGEIEKYLRERHFTIDKTTRDDEWYFCIAPYFQLKPTWFRWYFSIQHFLTDQEVLRRGIVINRLKKIL